MAREGSHFLIASSNKHLKKEVTGIGFVTSERTSHQRFDDRMPAEQHPGRSGSPSGWKHNSIWAASGCSDWV